MSWPRNFWRDLLFVTDRRRRNQLAVATVLLIILIGVADRLLGFEISLLVFYCLPVVLGTAALGWRFGVGLALASVGLWVAGDLAAGAVYSHWIVLGWNALIALVTYLVIIWLFATVRSLQLEMQDRVRQRTEALTAEIAERQRLERVILEIGERERANLGQQLHDNLGQHLTGTAFAAQVFGEKLQALGLAEQADAWKLVALVEEGIEKTRLLAKGLLLVEVRRDGLVQALQELAATMSGQFQIACEFRLEGDGLTAENDTATHLLHIAQEAVRNAVRHGGARHVTVSLRSHLSGLDLTVVDDGCGLPPPAARGDGLGLRIMAHRAQLIGARFAVSTAPGGGTVVRCELIFPVAEK